METQERQEFFDALDEAAGGSRVGRDMADFLKGNQEFAERVADTVGLLFKEEKCHPFWRGLCGHFAGYVLVRAAIARSTPAELTAWQVQGRLFENMVKQAQCSVLVAEEALVAAIEFAAQILNSKMNGLIFPILDSFQLPAFADAYSLVKSASAFLRAECDKQFSLPQSQIEGLYRDMMLIDMILVLKAPRHITLAAYRQQLRDYAQQTAEDGLRVAIEPIAEHFAAMQKKMMEQGILDKRMMV